MTARELIEGVIESGLVSIKKGAILSGHAVAQLKPKQEVFIDGKRARIIDVTTRPVGTVEVVYVVGAKSFGAERTLVLHMSDTHTPLQAVDRTEYSYEEITEALTRGMRNAMSRMRHREVCSKCELAIPVYPGRYPARCPECGEILKRPESRRK